MKRLLGGPGTISGLVLRLGQCAFGAASIGVMVTAVGFSNYTAFCMLVELSVPRVNDACQCNLHLFSFHMYEHCPTDTYRNFMVLFPTFSYLVASIGLQVLWSFGLACLDIYALRSKRDLQNPILVSLFVVGDWVTATLSLAAACSSAGIVVLYAKDLDVCMTRKIIPCSRYQMSIAMAFVTWAFTAMSSHVMFWTLASL